ncbi:putative inactive dehydrogenase EasA [Hypsizygus marmoreus]|uniref:Inactive dehydrogenase EasA n=1 Tax=Hypsizygus marmoreus TaxID=39966 RepID=A0A369JA81_HYPMA|nr:putative inactive dehydrogenase EasA [Hypsizygus marmoreus]
MLAIRLTKPTLEFKSQTTMSLNATTPKLFQPIRIGNITLSHRVVLAPLTRFKATKKSHIPVVPLVKEYYSQRSSTPGTLVITEATFIAAQAGGYANVPGIWSQDQIRAWKEVTTRVHENGSFIFLQLWAQGRAAQPDVLTSEDLSFVAPSPIPLSSRPTPIPRELTIAEIKEYVRLYAQAAKNAIHEAGFDGVEVHGANGYFVDQFLQDVSNQRSDEYGGSVEGRSKFPLEVVDAVVDAVGPERTAIRLSPWSKYQDMAMKDPVPQFSHFVSALKAKHPTLAYLHVVEPRMNGIFDRAESDVAAYESNDFIRAIWNPLPLISAASYTRETAIEAAEKHGDLIAFGRMYISNPDLPLRLKKNIPLTPYDRNTFYVPADQPNPEVGYIDYPFAAQDA